MICDSDVSGDLQDLLDADDLAIVLDSKHRPRCIIEFISQSLQLLNLEATKQNMLVSLFLDYINTQRFPFYDDIFCSDLKENSIFTSKFGFCFFFP